MLDANNTHLKRLRLFEIERLKSYFKPGSIVLEIGAGAGWQSRYLSELGVRVIAVDVASTNYDFRGNWNVILYDGYRLPVANHSIDIVFSSNVLEHIAHVEAFQAEIHRVIKPEGLAIHLMPSTSWRFWTSLGKYVDSFTRLSRKFQSRTFSSYNTVETKTTKLLGPQISIKERFSNLFVPETHGEIGNFITELYFFSCQRWLKLFKATGWRIETVTPNGLFYTGYDLMGDNLSFPVREKLSYILGCACWVYVLRSASQS